MEGLNQYLTNEQRSEFNPVPIELETRQAIFHHPLLVHGSHENKSDNARWAFVLNVFADGTRSETDKEPLEGVPPVPKGEKIGGQFFPLLYEPDKK